MSLDSTASSTARSRSECSEPGWPGTPRISSRHCPRGSRRQSPQWNHYSDKRANEGLRDGKRVWWASRRKGPLAGTEGWISLLHPGCFLSLVLKRGRVGCGSVAELLPSAGKGLGSLPGLAKKMYKVKEERPGRATAQVEGTGVQMKREVGPARGGEDLISRTITRAGRLLQNNTCESVQTLQGFRQCLSKARVRTS